MTVSEFPEMRMKKVLEAIEEIKEMGLTDPFEIAKIYDIDVVITKINTVPAFFNRSKTSGRTTIYIDSNTNNNARDLLCAHELGHILCEDSDTDMFNHKVNPVSEFTANSFMLLVMGNTLNDFTHSSITGNTKIENINQKINMLVQVKREKNYNGQYSIFELIDVNDDFWSMI